MEFYKSRNFDRKKPKNDFKHNDKSYRSFRNSRDDRKESATVTCADCGTECEIPFVPKTNRPVYCSDCFRQNKPQDSAGDRYSRDDRESRYSRNDRGSRSRDDRESRYSRNDRGSRSRDDRKESATVTCADCGTECEIPFVPKTNRPVYCSDCFRQNKPQDSAGDRYSRDDRESRYSRNDRGSRSRDDRKESATVTCADCGTECEIPFVPKTNRPVYCSDCFRQNKPQDSAGDRYSRDDRESRYSRNDRGSRSRDDRKESATVTCADCGTECEIPFVPKTNRPVYCSDCFRQNKPQDSAGDRYSRDDRESRYSRNDRGSRSRDDRKEIRKDNFRSNRSKNDRFLKKQENFYSNGSDKFYAALKEKLFEILGGKICSSCGFKDERALGINHISDDVSTNDIGRGGSASSWGKYISEPDLARKELKVLCLNCNEIRQPISKPKETRSNNANSKHKKSKYFPR